MQMENMSPQRRFHWDAADDDWVYIVCEYAATCLMVMLAALFFLTLLSAAGV